MNKKERNINIKKESRQRRNKRKAEKKEVARLAAIPIGGICNECGLKVRSNTMEKHRAGMHHINGIKAQKKGLR